MKMTRKLISLALILVCTLSLVACGQPPAATAPPTNPPTSNPANTSGAPGTPEPAPPDEPVTLKFAYGGTATNVNGVSYQYLIDRIHEFSNGSITVEFYPAGSLLNDAEMLDAIMTGNVDMGHFQIANLTPTIKELTPFEVPGAYPGNNFLEWSELIHPIVDDIFQKYGLKYYASIGQDTQVLLGLDGNYRTPDDLIGQKIRVAGKWYADAVTAWGGAPATIPIADLASALDRKTVDGVYTAWVAILSYRLYENVSYVTMTNQQENFVGVMMNLDRWNSLSDNQRAAMQAAFEAYRPWNFEKLMEAKNNLYDTLEEYDVTVYELTDEENAAFNARTAPMMDEVRKICGEDGLRLIEAFESFKTP